MDQLKRIVVAIDLGTAARLDSIAIAIDYSRPFGALRYSAPETYCGLAGHRHIAHYTDYYALGCMLFELFSPNYFDDEIRHSGQFDQVCAALNHLLVNTQNPKARLALYERYIMRFSHAIPIPSFRSHSISAPAAIVDLLDRALIGLVALDYRDRVTSLDRTRSIIDLALRVLANDKKASLRVERKRRERRQKEERLRRSELRLAKYLGTSSLLGDEKND